MAQTWDARTKLAQEAVDGLTHPRDQACPAALNVPQAMETGELGSVDLSSQKPAAAPEAQPQSQETITRHVNDNPDSLEIGTPAKGGAIKIYGSYADPEAFKAKLENAFMVRRHAQSLMGGE